MICACNRLEDRPEVRFSGLVIFHSLRKHLNVIDVRLISLFYDPLVINVALFVGIVRQRLPPLRFKSYRILKRPSRVVLLFEIEMVPRCRLDSNRYRVPFAFWIPFLSCQPVDRTCRLQRKCQPFCRTRTVPLLSVVVDELLLIFLVFFFLFSIILWYYMFGLVFFFFLRTSYLHGTLSGNDTVYVFGERIEATIGSSHEVRFQ